VIFGSFPAKQCVMPTEPMVVAEDLTAKIRKIAPLSQQGLFSVYRDCSLACYFSFSTRERHSQPVLAIETTLCAKFKSVNDFLSRISLFNAKYFVSTIFQGNERH